MGFTGLLDKTCTTQRSSNSRGALGTAKTFTTNLTGVPCRLQQVRGDELHTTTDSTTALVADHKLWFDYGTDITAKDRVVIGSTTYEVLDVNADVAGAGHHAAAMLLEVR